MPTGHTFHRYLNPERAMAAEDFAVHGLSGEFLADKPLFSEVAEDFLEFIGDAPLVIHNASFDISFINAELDRLKRPPIPRERLVDTLLLARRKHPGVSNRLDDLCSRYAIDNSHRTKHGALLDAELLAEVYIDLIGARQSQLILAAESATSASAALATCRGGSARYRWRRGSPRKISWHTAPLSPRWAKSRSGTNFGLRISEPTRNRLGRYRLAALGQLGLTCPGCAPWRRPAAPCSGGKG